MMGKLSESIQAHDYVSKYAVYSYDQAIGFFSMGVSLMTSRKVRDAYSAFLNSIDCHPLFFPSYLCKVECLIQMKSYSNVLLINLMNDMIFLEKNYTNLQGPKIARQYPPFHRTLTFEDFPQHQSLNQYPTYTTIPPIQCDIYFAIFQCAHYLGVVDVAWQYLQQGHAVKHSILATTTTPTHTPITDVTLTESWRHTLSIERIFTPCFWPAGVGHPAATPVFVIGMMRSGSSLLEHMLDAHSCVTGIGEESVLNATLPAVQREILLIMTSQASDTEKFIQIKTYVESIGDSILQTMADRAADIRNENLSLLGRNDKDNVHHQRSTRVVDKMLFNYRNVGLIHLLFPNAVILHTVRDPMDTIWSIYRHKFDDPGDAIQCYMFDMSIVRIVKIGRSPVGLGYSIDLC
jgi:hypothetical protein